MRKKALVLGAGIQGISCALALQKNGYDVLLIDKNAEPFSQTSFVGEAKIHLGYVYANDASFRTASLLLRSAMHFAPLVDKWTDSKIPWAHIRSNPFTYAVHRDSMVPLDDLQKHYHQIEEAYQTYRNSGLHYIGYQEDKLVAKHVCKASCLNPSVIQSTIATQEVALHTAALKPILLESLKNGRTRFLMERTVQSVRRTAAGFAVAGVTKDGRDWSEEGDIVVNCLWDSRLQLDSSLALRPARPWVYRRKFRLLGRLPNTLAGLASYTIVLGPFGDIVTYPQGLTYLSWYPTCQRGWSTELLPPLDWNNLSALPSSAWVTDTLQALDKIVPGLNQFDVHRVDAGVIFSWGETDIDDPNSQLHSRYNIGVNAFDGYFSIDTGKFTSAPLFAQSLLSHL